MWLSQPLTSLTRLERCCLGWFVAVADDADYDCGSAGDGHNDDDADADADPG